MVGRLQDLLRWDAREGLLHADLPPDWAQGRATFGGLVCGAALHAMTRQAPADRPARSLHATFVGPVAPGPATLEARRLGGGRSASHLEARLVQDEVRLVATATFGADRPSSLALAAPPRPDLPDPEALEALPYLEGLTPAFTRHFDFRLAGPMPFSGQRQPGFSGWVRLREAHGPLDAALAVALLDAWPPAAVSMLAGPAPSSTATLSALFTLPEAPVPAGGWFAFRSTATWVGGGWADLRAALWTADGHQLATMTQLSAVYG